MRPNALRLNFIRLGDGQVVLDDAEENLIPHGQPVIPGPQFPGTGSNIRLHKNVAKVRLGYKAFADTPDTVAITGIHHSRYDDDTQELLRGTSTGMRRYNSSTNAWDDIKGGATIGATDNDTWTFAEVERVGSSLPGNETFLCNGVDNIFQFRPGMASIASVGAATVTAARVLLGFKSRALAMNVKEMPAGTRRTQRVQRSILGDPTTWTGTGSGFTDLDEDVYPIEAAAALGGRISIYKGNQEGGSIVVATPTGSANNPYRYDTIDPGSGIGILLPRTLVRLGPDLAFFFSHRGFVLHDGARGLVPVAPRSSEHILSRVNPNALRGGVAWLRAKSGEVVTGIPTGASQWPTEFWVFNIARRTMSGPWTFAQTITSATTFATTGTLTIDTLPGPDIDSLPYPSIDEMGGAAGPSSIILGTSQGVTAEDDDATTTDLGSPVSGTLYLPPVTPDGFTIGQRVLTAEDELTLRDVTLGYRDTGSWTPQVDVSTDGGSTWVTVSDGAQIGTGATGRLRHVSYEPVISGSWVQVRVSGASGMELQSISLEFTHGGARRAG